MGWLLIPVALLGFMFLMLKFAGWAVNGLRWETDLEGRILNLANLCIAVVAFIGAGAMIVATWPEISRAVFGSSL